MRQNVLNGAPEATPAPTGGTGWFDYPRAPVRAEHGVYTALMAWSERVAHCTIRAHVEEAVCKRQEWKVVVAVRVIAGAHVSPTTVINPRHKLHAMWLDHALDVTPQLREVRLIVAIASFPICPKAGCSICLE